MPTTTNWVAPEVFLTYRGVTVFHTYRDNDFNQGRCPNQFTLDNQSDEHPFLISNLDVPSRALLKKTPPFLCADSNPLFAAATDEQKSEWAKQWHDWHNGTLDTIQKAILTEAIDQGLLTALECQVGLYACDDCHARTDDIISCPDGAQICQQCFDAGAH